MEGEIVHEREEQEKDVSCVKEKLSDATQCNWC